MHLRIASLAARNLAGTLDADVAMVAKKTRRLAQIFEFCVRMVVGIWPEDLSISAMRLGYFHRLGMARPLVPRSCLRDCHLSQLHLAFHQHIVLQLS
jgi:hypothetical protein